MYVCIYIYIHDWCICLLGYEFTNYNFRQTLELRNNILPDGWHSSCFWNYEYFLNLFVSYFVFLSLSIYIYNYICIVKHVKQIVGEFTIKSPYEMYPGMRCARHDIRPKRREHMLRKSDLHICSTACPIRWAWHAMPRYIVAATNWNHLPYEKLTRLARD